MKALYAFRPWDETTYPRNIALRAPAILATWLKHFPESQPSNRDEEDWIENAILLHEAEAAGLDLIMVPSKGDRIMVSGAGWLAPQAKPNAPIGAMLGVWSMNDFVNGLPIDMNPVGSCSAAVRAAGDYATSATFQRFAGRPTALANGDVEGPKGIEAALRQVVDDSNSGELFIKTVQKAWAAPFTVDPNSDRGLWAQLCTKDLAAEEQGEGYGLSYIPVQYEGSTNSVLLIQGRIKPTYEYRVFVVDGQPVTGAGCIEAFTPAENKELFDPQMERIRNKSAVEDQADLRNRYLRFARQFITQFAIERGDGLDYSLDLCVDEATGEICVLELNPPLNLGRYASDVGAWLTAVVDRTERLAG